MTVSAARPDISTERDISTGRNITVSVTVDGELLLEARRQLDADSVSAVVDEALRRLVEQEREKRLQAFDRLRRVAEEGLIDFEAIERSRKCRT